MAEEAEPTYGWGEYVSENEVLVGNITTMGSDTLTNVMAIWSYDFSQYHPAFRIQVEGKGSSTAPPALIEGTADIGVMSRRMTAAEVLQFTATYGREPLVIPVALDAVVVYVNARNPITGLRLSELDSIFSATRLRGAQAIERWGDLELSGEWASRLISAYGRNPASGTYAFFKAHVLAAGDFKKHIQEIPGSSALVQLVGTDLHAIGYSGIGYKTGNVRALPISTGESNFYDPSYENCLSGKYPLARPIFLYLVRSETGKISPKNRAFLNYVLSEQAQKILISEGFFPIPREDALRMKATLL